MQKRRHSNQAPEGLISNWLDDRTWKTCFHIRFLDALTNKRREQQEKLAEKALTEARKKKEEAERKAAAAEAAAAKSQQNGPKSAPVTPATTPGAVREGTFDVIMGLEKLKMVAPFLAVTCLRHGFCWLCMCTDWVVEGISSGKHYSWVCCLFCFLVF